MSLVEAVGWLVVAATLVCWTVYGLGQAWARYCSRAIERQRNAFWAHLARELESRSRRYHTRQGPYR